MVAWLVNTNSKAENGNPNGYKFMLRQNKAAAYYGRKTEIDKISPHDLILLYHNDNRVIAVGFAVDRMKHDYKDLSSIEHWVDVNWIWKANFDDNFNPTNSINRHDLEITMVNGTVLNITGQIRYDVLFEEIGKRQSFL